MADNLPIFLSEDAEAIVSDLKASLEAATSRVLSDADVEMELVNVFAYREKKIRIDINNTGRQNLVAFASGNMLDYLGELVGVTRLVATGSVCTMQLTFVDGHPAISITDPVRFQTGDGKAIFITDTSIIVPVGTNTVNVPVTCTTSGIFGNGYVAGAVNIILDPQAFLSFATNIDTTVGGADDESDDAFRQRIMLAPNSFSVAGPKKAYEFFAKSANQSIIDVKVTSNAPGQVDIYALLQDGTIPNQDILNQILAICNDEKVRPLTDSVFVHAPTEIDYDIVVELILYTGALDDEVLSTVNSNLNDYKQKTLNLLGCDVVRSQLNSLCSIDGKVYDVNIVSPSADIVVDDSEYARCNFISVTINGYNNG